MEADPFFYRPAGFLDKRHLHTSAPRAARDRPWQCRASQRGLGIRVTINIRISVRVGVGSGIGIGLALRLEVGLGVGL